MEITTQYFGKISCTEKDLIYFADGLFGFTQYKQYIALPFEEDSDAMLCLQSVDDPEISFILMNPFQLDKNYSPLLSGEDEKALELSGNDQAVSYYVICTASDSLVHSTVNLKSPIAVNTDNRKARQIMLDQAQYLFRHPLKSFATKEASHADSAT